MAVGPPADRPKAVCNCCVIEVFGGVCVIPLCVVRFSVCIEAFVIQQSQISPFSLLIKLHIFINFIPKQVKLCGNLICKVHETCVTSKLGANLCAPPDAKLCQRHLVSGPYGVSADRVTWSSFYDVDGDNLVHYQLNGHDCWAAGSENKNQWIEVSTV